jgi:hypothetical protein
MHRSDTRISRDELYVTPPCRRSFIYRDLCISSNVSVKEDNMNDCGQQT